MLCERVVLDSQSENIRVAQEAIKIIRSKGQMELLNFSYRIIKQTKEVECRKWALEVLTSSLGSATCHIPISIMSWLTELYFSDVFSPEAKLVDSMSDAVVDGQIYLFYRLYPETIPDMLSLTNPKSLLYLAGDRLCPFLNKLTHTMVTRMAHLPCNSPRMVQEQMLSDGSQANIMNVLKKHMNIKDPLICATLSGLMKWMDIRVLLSVGLDTQIKAWISSPDTAAMGLSLIRGMCQVDLDPRTLHERCQAMKVFEILSSASLYEEKSVRGDVQSTIQCVISKCKDLDVFPELMGLCEKVLEYDLISTSFFMLIQGGMSRKNLELERVFEMTFSSIGRHVNQITSDEQARNCVLDLLTVAILLCSADQDGSLGLCERLFTRIFTVEATEARDQLLLLFLQAYKNALDNNRVNTQTHRILTSMADRALSEMYGHSCDFALLCSLCSFQYCWRRASTSSNYLKLFEDIMMHALNSGQEWTMIFRQLLCSFSNARFSDDFLLFVLDSSDDLALLQFTATNLAANVRNVQPKPKTQNAAEKVISRLLEVEDLVSNNLYAHGIDLCTAIANCDSKHLSDGLKGVIIRFVERAISVISEKKLICNINLVALASVCGLPMLVDTWRYITHLHPDQLQQIASFDLTDVALDIRRPVFDLFMAIRSHEKIEKGFWYLLWDHPVYIVLSQGAQRAAKLGVVRYGSVFLQDMPPEVFLQYYRCAVSIIQRGPCIDPVLMKPLCDALADRYPNNYLLFQSLYDPWPIAQLDLRSKNLISAWNERSEMLEQWGYFFDFVFEKAFPESFPITNASCKRNTAFLNSIQAVIAVCPLQQCLSIWTTLRDKVQSKLPWVHKLSKRKKAREQMSSCDDGEAPAQAGMHYRPDKYANAYKKRIKHRNEPQQPLERPYEGNYRYW